MGGEGVRSGVGREGGFRVGDVLACPSVVYAAHHLQVGVGVFGGHLHTGVCKRGRVCLCACLCCCHRALCLVDVQGCSPRHPHRVAQRSCWGFVHTAGPPVEGASPRKNAMSFHSLEESGWSPLACSLQLAPCMLLSLWAALLGSSVSES